MFGSKSSSAVVSDGTTLIASGTEVSGRITFSGCLEVEGVVRGNIIADADSDTAQVRIQGRGEVHGDVCAPVVIVNGSIEGNVYSGKRVELAANAAVCGDVHYQVIEMVKGAQINGSLMYSSAPVAPALGNDEAAVAPVDADEVLGEYVDAGLQN